MTNRISQHQVVPVILLGAGGHAKVVMDTLHAMGLPLIGVVDPALKHTGQSQWRGVPVLGDDTDLLQWKPNEVRLANGIGSLPGQKLRMTVFDKFQSAGFEFATLVHPFSYLGSGVVLEEGAQVMAGCVIQADSHIGKNALINTRASIDHDTHIGMHTHVAPGVVISGGVTIGKSCHIGTGVAVIQGIHLGQGVVVGAGTLVHKDLADNALLVGAPPQPVKIRTQEVQ